MSGTLFRTNIAPSNQPALYQLSIRSPGDAFGELITYTFPLTPNSIQVIPTSLTSYANTQGPSQSNGVTRVFDIFGLSPPDFLIEGTTGWDFHSADGFTMTGLESIQLLQSVFTTYASLNKQQQEAGNPQMYTLEFYDFFQNNFFQVEPVGPQIVRQSNDRPLLTYYKFRLAGVQPVGGGVPIADPIAILLGAAVGAVIANTVNTFATFFGGYGPTGQSV
jgi:hypothetical protein